MINGCEKCAQVEGLCLDCEIEQADADVCRAMHLLERLQKKKQKLEEERKANVINS